MMLLLEPAGQGIHEECIRRAFKGVETEEEFKRYNELFGIYCELVDLFDPEKTSVMTRLSSFFHE